MPYPYYSNYPYYQTSYSTNSDIGIKWVEGKVGAQAYQMPPGLPFNTPIALWDSTDKKIFVKSWNAMGAANPMQEIKYEMVEEPKLLENISQDMNKYATKEDLEQLKQEIQNLSRNMNINNNNRGGGNR